MRGDACRNVHDKQTVIIYIYTSTQLAFLSGQNDGMSQPAFTILKSQLDCPESCDINRLEYLPHWGSRLLLAT